MFKFIFPTKHSLWSDNSTGKQLALMAALFSIELIVEKCSRAA